MKCFVFFIITWALVASFPLDKGAQVNTISPYSCNLSGFLQELQLRFAVDSHILLLPLLLLLLLFIHLLLLMIFLLYFFNRMKIIMAKTKTLVSIPVGFS